MALTLKQKISTTVFAAILAVATALIVLTKNSFTEQTQNAWQYRVRGLTETTISDFDDRFHQYARAMQGFAKMWPHRDMVDALALIKESNQLDMTFFGASDGVGTLSNGVIIPVDPRERPWYKQAVAENKTIYSAPYIDSVSNNITVTVAHPVMENGRLAGAVGGDISLSNMISDLAGFHFGDNAFGMLITQNGTIVAHRDADLAGNSLVEYNEQLTQSKIRDAAKSGELIETTLNGEPKAYLFSPIPSTGWILGIEVDLSSEAKPVNEVLTTLIITSIVLTIVIILLVIWLVNVLFKDLARISLAMQSIASGDADLTQRLDTTSKDEVGQLANSFNTFVSNMHELIGDLQKIAKSLTEQANQSAEEAHSRSAQVQAQLDEINLVATAINQMAGATQEISSSAENTAHQAKQALELSRNGVNQVDQSQASIGNLSNEVESATQVIAELDADTQSINSILSTIQDIAEQTNLLALNAAIEAARAGEQGRGFAVVADEVRVLSQRTHSSTREIQTTIEMLQQKAKSAVSIMQDSRQLATATVEDVNLTTNSLSEITSSVSTISDLSMQIASAVEEQSLVSSEITRNTASVRVAADALADDAKHAMERAEALSALSRSLNDELGRFRL